MQRLMDMARNMRSSWRRPASITPSTTLTTIVGMKAFPAATLRGSRLIGARYAQSKYWQWQCSRNFGESNDNEADGDVLRTNAVDAG